MRVFRRKRKIAPLSGEVRLPLPSHGADVHWAATDEIKTEHYSILTRAEWLARQKPED